MGSSKSAMALMCKYNYEQKGFKVLLLKPTVDTRDDSGGKRIVKSRIGLESQCETFESDQNLLEFCKERIDGEGYGVVIVDEAQFCTAKQIDELKAVTEFVPVLCYGLKTNFKTLLFEGSKRLLEIAESCTEIKSVCGCGKKATVNARLIDGKIVTTGEEIVIGGNESYQSMCYDCWNKEKSLN